MKVLHLNHSDSIGGAAKYTRRIHDSLCSNGHDSFMCCSSVKIEDPRIFRINPEMSNLKSLLIAKTCQYADRKISILEKTSPPNYTSVGWIGAVNAKWINKSNFDIVHLHWINGGLISIREIGLIEKPIVWSMLDMWPFLGVNHYENFNKEARWVKGYSEVGRPENYRGIDLNKINSGKKKSSWNSRITFIAPGHWLRGQAQASSILKGKEVLVIPPALDTNKFTPSVDKKSNVRGNRFTIGYGGALATRKGWPLFQKFLNTFSGNLVDSKIITFGSEPSEEFNSPYYDVLQMGKNKSEDELKMIYQQLDVLIFPSTVEAYGLIAQEAQSCGVPVICISNTGAEDVIIPNVTGLAIVNTINALTEAIEIYKQNQDFLKSSSFRARLHAESSWSYDVVSKQIGSLYRQVLIQHKTRLD